MKQNGKLLNARSHKINYLFPFNMENINLNFIKDYFSELDGYRGIAALLIVVFHAYQHSRVFINYPFEGSPLHLLLINLDFAVACFFVLSGFLLFLPFVNSLLNNESKISARK